jgi:hypothetical protein
MLSGRNHGTIDRLLLRLLPIEHGKNTHEFHVAAAFTCSKFKSAHKRCDRFASSAHGAMVGDSSLSALTRVFQPSNNGFQPAGCFFQICSVAGVASIPNQMATV